MKSRYLGEGTEELRARLVKAEALKAAASERRETMARLVRVLRAEGFIATDRDTGSLLLAFARAGVFRLGGTLVGTAANALFQGELDVRIDSEELAQTGDIDFPSFERLSVALGDRVEEEPGDILQSLKFDPVPALQGRQVPGRPLARAALARADRVKREEVAGNAGNTQSADLIAVSDQRPRVPVWSSVWD